MDVQHYKTERLNAREGFTLVESLIGIAILVMAVLAPLTIAQSSIQGARYAQQQTTAIFLAQEAVELVKYQVYQNINEGNGWLAGIDGNAGSDVLGTYSTIYNCITEDCEISGPRNDADGLFRECDQNVTAGSELNCRVYINSDTNIYRSQGTGTQFQRTPFRRAIRLENAGTWEAKVVVNVYWNAPDGTSRTYTLEDYVYRWR